MEFICDIAAFFLKKKSLVEKEEMRPEIIFHFYFRGYFSRLEVFLFPLFVFGGVFPPKIYFIISRLDFWKNVYFASPSFL